MSAWITVFTPRHPLPAATASDLPRCAGEVSALLAARQNVTHESFRFVAPALPCR